jgi:hypothetical protein
MTPYELAEELRSLRRRHPLQVPPGVEDAAEALEALAEEVARLRSELAQAQSDVGLAALAAEAEVARLQERVEELEAGELAWRAAVTGSRWAGR